MTHTHFTFGEKEQRLVFHTGTPDAADKKFNFQPLDTTERDDAEKPHHEQEMTPDQVVQSYKALLVRTKDRLDAIGRRLYTARQSLQHEQTKSLEGQEAALMQKIRALAGRQIEGDHRKMQEDLKEDEKERAPDKEKNAADRQEFERLQQADVEKMNALKMRDEKIKREIATTLQQLGTTEGSEYAQTEKKLNSLQDEQKSIVLQIQDLKSHKHNDFDPVEYRRQWREHKREDLVGMVQSIDAAEQNEAKFQKDFKEAKKGNRNLSETKYRDVWNALNVRDQNMKEEEANKVNVDFQAKRKEFFDLNRGGLQALETELNRRHAVWVGGYADKTPNSGNLAPTRYKSPKESIASLNNALQTSEMRERYRFLNEVPEGKLTVSFDPRSGRVNINEYRNEVRDANVQDMADKIVRESGGYETDPRDRRAAETRDRIISHLQSEYDRHFVANLGDTEKADRNFRVYLDTKFNPARVRAGANGVTVAIKPEIKDGRIISVKTDDEEQAKAIKFLREGTRTYKPPVLGGKPLEKASQASIGISTTPTTPPPIPKAETQPTPTSGPAATVDQPRTAPAAPVTPEVKVATPTEVLSALQLDSEQISKVLGLLASLDYTSSESRQNLLDALNTIYTDPAISYGGRGVDLADYINKQKNPKNNPFDQLSYEHGEFVFGTEDTREIGLLSSHGREIKEFIASNMGVDAQQKFLRDLDGLGIADPSILTAVEKVVNDALSDKNMKLVKENGTYQFQLKNAKTKAEENDFSISSLTAKYTKEPTMGNFIELVVAYIKQFALGMNPNPDNAKTDPLKNVEKRKAGIVDAIKKTPGCFPEWDKQKTKGVEETQKKLAEQRNEMGTKPDALKKDLIQAAITSLEKQLATEDGDQKLGREMAKDMKDKSEFATTQLKALEGRVSDNILKGLCFKFDPATWMIKLEISATAEAAISGSPVLREQADKFKKGTDLKGLEEFIKNLGSLTDPEKVTLSDPKENALARAVRAEIDASDGFENWEIYMKEANKKLRGKIKEQLTGVSGPADDRVIQAYKDSIKQNEEKLAVAYKIFGNPQSGQPQS